MDKQNQKFYIAIIGGLFFIFGFVTWLNATLIPYLKMACELTNFQAFFVTFAFYMSYFFMAIPSSYVLRKTGFKNGMSLGLFVMAVGSMIFIPAATSRTYWLFLFGLFVQGAGLTLLQTASNPYITILGPIESAARRISIMGICNKVAGILSPLILASIVMAGADKLEIELKTMDAIQKANTLDMLSSRVILPYVIMAIALVLLGLIIRFSPLPEINEEENDKPEEDSNNRSIFAYPQLIFGVLAIFLYVGVEVIAADTLSNYGKSIGIPMKEAKTFPSVTLTCMLVGYVIGIFAIPTFITQQTALKLSAGLGIIFSCLIYFLHGYASIFLIAALGLANALMWPAIWPLAIDGIGKHIKTGSAMLIMGIAGGALLPLLYAAIGDAYSLKAGYLIMIPCYFFILWYSNAGFHRKAESK
ncbi:MAG: sugar MFS transporter [Bacteroidetes bacterium]|nr:sugar MFS transporter [Bacteroidota bacterium]